MSARLVVLIALLFLVAASLFGADLSGRDLVVPVISRVPGVMGSDWRTDLIVTNEKGVDPVVVTLRFFPSGGTTMTAALKLAPFATATIEDVVLSTFNLSRASGLLRVIGPEGALIVARAYVYNTAATGQSGQSIPAVPLDALTGSHTMAGLTGLGDRRTNLGMANPWSFPMDVNIEFFDETGSSIARTALALPPSSLTQFDLFAELKVAPRAKTTVTLNAGYGGIYAYASTIQSSNGAATFVLGSGISSVNEDYGSPLCSAPAPLNRTFPRAAGWLVSVQPGSNATTFAALEAKYGFQGELFDFADGFFVEKLSAAQIAALRCDPSIRDMEENGIGAVQTRHRH
ncbi:MAG: hypothetical protein QOC81_561 [Thermoanaerobaculia bacterium]|jgi:hypothetical protein|nr:hypothetical protein [Thermoanaerobaculia bacterium]